MGERRSVHGFSILTAVFLMMSAAGGSVAADPPGMAASSQRETPESPADLRCVMSVTSGTGRWFDLVQTVAVDDEGSVIVARGPFTLYPRPETPAVFERLEPHGSIGWRWRPPPDETALFTDVAFDASGDAVVVGMIGAEQRGMLTSRALFVRLDTEGHDVPVADLDEHNAILRIQPLRSGGYVYLTIGGTRALVKTDASGHAIWRHTFDPEAVGPRALAVDAAENVIVVGGLARTTDFGGGALIATRRFEASDAFLVAYDAAGQHRWSRRFGDGDQWFDRVAMDREGNVVVVGRNHGTIDLGGGPIVGQGYFLASFDPEGRHRWSWALPANKAGSDYVRGLAVDASGAITIGGSFDETLDLGAGPMVSAGGSDVFLARFDAAGHLHATWRFGGPGDELLTHFAMSPRGVIVLSGPFSTPFDFGCGALPRPSNGTSDFVAVLAPSSAPMPVVGER